jgi:hypothetical protein
MKNLHFYKCDVCEKKDSEAILIKFPYTTTHKKEYWINEHVEEDSFICIGCIEEDYKNIGRLERTT